MYKRQVHIRKAVVQRLAERNGLKDDEADDPGDQVEQALPFVKKLLGRDVYKRQVEVFRIDAVPYIWKQLGTTCRNLPQVHKMCIRDRRKQANVNDNS